MRRVGQTRGRAGIRSPARWGWVCAGALAAMGCAAAEPPSNDDAASGDEDASASGAGGASTGGSGAGAQPTTGGAGSGGSPTSCVYPTGAYGVHVGELVDPAASWEGFLPGAIQSQLLAPADFYDCDGSRGIAAVLVMQSATWCGPCQVEAAALEGKMAQGWKALGVSVLTLMVEQQPEQPATVATAQAWKDQFGLTSVTVAADPAYTFDAFDFDQHISHSGFPTVLLIDPRTMQIVARQDSDVPLDAQVTALAQQNQ